MTNRDDGGPAFPTAGRDGGTDENGLSARDYFAAHAPPPSENWLNANPTWVPLQQPELPAVLEAARAAHVPDYTPGAFRGGCLEEDFDFKHEPWWTPELEAAAENFRHDFAAAKEAQEAETSRRAIDRLARWAWHYADSMIRTRPFPE